MRICENSKIHKSENKIHVRVVEMVPFRQSPISKDGVKICTPELFDGFHFIGDLHYASTTWRNRLDIQGDAHAAVVSAVESFKHAVSVIDDPNQDDVIYARLFCGDVFDDLQHMERDTCGLANSLISLHLIVNDQGERLSFWITPRPFRQPTPGTEHNSEWTLQKNLGWRKRCMGKSSQFV